MADIEIGQRWTHTLTGMAFVVILIDGEEILLDPEGEGQELTLSPSLLLQEFACPSVRSHSSKPSRRIKPGKIRRGLRR